ncbi:MAG TPA: hypothetical protein VGM14_30040 [Streptosporangiaceae bacterium]|jgi:hypothetical protein
MNIDEGDLRVSLNNALDEVDYGPLPLTSVISHGKTVVRRRRLTAVAGALVIAAAAVASPIIAHQIGRPAEPAASARYHVIVRPPGAKSPRGLIAYERLNHRHWRITGSAGRVNGQMNVCFEIFGDDCQISPIPVARDKGVPVDVDMAAGSAPLALVADVRSDVRYVQVSLSNGQIVTLKPVAVFGRSHAAWVALVVPYSAAVTMITAYSAKGQVGYAIPFGRGGLFSAVRWFAPGQPARPARATYKIASGEVHGKRWAEYAYVGPWGSCITGAGAGGGCIAEGLDGWGGAKPASLVRETADRPWVPKVAYYLLVAKPAVSYVLVHVKNAAPIRVPAFSKDGVKFFGFASAPPDAATRWVAYSAGGKVLATGKLRYHRGEEG